MKLIAKKPCSFGGKRFYIGDEIPVEMVHDPVTQEKYGTLTIVKDAAASEVTGPVESGGAPTVVQLTICGRVMVLENESIQTVMDVLTANAEDATDLIKHINSDDILFLVNAADSRKTVQTAAKARAQALMEAQEGEESAGDQ